ncbi:translation initiation factor IF-2-like [Bubalus bubalis]|uniref:translation initiation factor IF-2-like n=1 Tax=Bubalus bubalis TaxID=89462 RepID=UPI001E1B8EC3|nr:translation initiation factor IF-2-like [Bubalus bubalis]
MGAPGRPAQWVSRVPARACHCPEQPPAGPDLSPRLCKPASRQPRSLGGGEPREGRGARAAAAGGDSARTAGRLGAVPALGEGGAPCGPQPDPQPRPRSPREPVRTHLPTAGEGSTRPAPPLSNSRLQVERPGAERLRAGEVAANFPRPPRRPRRARGPGRMLSLMHAAGRRDLPAPRRAPRGQAGSGAHTAGPRELPARFPSPLFSCQRGSHGGPGGVRSAVVCRGRPEEIDILKFQVGRPTVLLWENEDHPGESHAGI